MPFCKRWGHNTLSHSIDIDGYTDQRAALQATQNFRETQSAAVTEIFQQAQKR